MRKRLSIGTIAVLIIVILMLGGNTWRNAAGWQPITETPAQRLALLRPDWRLQMPDGNGPFPAAILLSGCDGVRDNMAYWADVLTKQGYAALIVDSHSPRGLERHQAWRAVCAAQLLPGAERAGDIAVAMAALDDMPGIDARDVMLLGASHGGWSIMEYLRLLDSDTPPPGLTAWPMDRTALRARIGPVALLYPYCGVVSQAGEAVWPDQYRGLMVLGTADSIIDSEKCEEMAAGLQASGAHLRLTVLEGADHGFDQRDRSTLSLLEFSPEYTAAATEAVKQLIRDFRNPDPAAN